MKILSIDTTSVYGSVALSEGARLVVQEQQGVAGTHAERLLPTIDHLLSVAGWRRGDIEAIAVAKGPGSFTGLRIGIATTKGMALATGCRVAGVSSLESLALNGAGFEGAVATLIDARRGELYAAVWNVPADGMPKGLVGECVLPPEELIGKLRSIRGPMMLVGDGALAYRDLLEKNLGKRAIVPGSARCLPQAMNLALLALPALGRGAADDLSGLVPNYIRRSDAEIGFLGRKSPSFVRRGKGR